jgi:hypothetical protein
MTYPTVFANLAAGTQPASLLDTMFNQAGFQGNIACTATGTNAITLTPNSNFFLPAAYTNYQMVSFTPAATSTGAVTAQIAALGQRQVFNPSGVQANVGDIALGNIYVMTFASSLNSGAGAWQIVNTTAPSVVQPFRGTFQNLIVGPTTNTTIPIACDWAILGAQTGGANAQQVRVGTGGVQNISLTLSQANGVGINGIDTGTFAAATSYYIYLIYNPTSATVASIASTNANPNNVVLPAGYTFIGRCGWARTDQGDTNFKGMIQRGKFNQWLLGGGGLTVLPTVVSSAGGNVVTPIFVTFNFTQQFLPIQFAGSGRFIAVLGASASSIIAAPNTSYGGNTANTGIVPPLCLSGGATATASGNITTVFEMNFEVAAAGTPQLFWANNNNANALFLLGYTDNDIVA